MTSAVTRAAPRAAMAIVFAAGALALAAPTQSLAGNWTLGERTSYACRASNGNVRGLQYCHNCAARIGGSGAYVSWVFPAKCNGRDTGHQVRGELKCVPSPGDETRQKQLITANAVGKLPKSSAPCP